MNFLALLCIIFLSRLCGSTGPQNPGRSDSIRSLELQIDASLFSTDRLDDNGIPVLKCVARANTRSYSFHCGPETIWTGNGEDVCTSALMYIEGGKPVLVTLQVKNDDNEGVVFLYHTGDEWIQDGDRHRLKLKELQGIAQAKAHIEKSRYESPWEPGTVDISSFDYPNYRVIDVDIDGVPSRILMMNPGTTVTRIVDGGTEVWKDVSPGVNCLYCIQHLQNNEPKMMSIVVCKPDGLFQVFREYKKTAGTLSKIGIGDKRGWNPSGNDYLDRVSTLKVDSGTPSRIPIDISSDEDTEKFKIIRYEQYGVTVKFFVARPGYIIDKVMDGTNDKWAVKDGYLCFMCEVHTKNNYSLVRTHLKHDKIVGYLSMEKKKGEWKNLSAWEHTLRFNQLYKKGANAVKRETTPVNAPPYILDLVNPDKKKTDLDGNTNGGVDCKTFAPKDGHRISSVVENGTPIWTASGNSERCEYVTWLSKDKSNFLALDIQECSGAKTKHFEKVGRAWTCITSKTFTVKVKAIMEVGGEYGSPRKPLNTTPCILDLDNPDESTIGFHREMTSGVNISRYFPTDGYHISSIKKGKVPVWICLDGEKCEYVTVSSKGDSILVSLDVSGAKKEYLELTGGSWKEITKEDYDAKCKAMANVSTESPRVKSMPTGYHSKMKDVSTENSRVKNVPTNDHSRTKDVSTDKPRVKNVSTDHLRVKDILADKRSKRESVPTENLRAAPVKNSRIPLSEESTASLSRFSKEVNWEERMPFTSLPSGPITMDVANLCSQNYNHFDYIYDDNYIRLFIPNEGVTVAKLVDGEHFIWMARPDERFEFAKAYINESNKPVLLVINKSDMFGISHLRYRKTWTKWMACQDYSNELDKLKVPVETTRKFFIDLEDEEDTEECIVFKERLLRVLTRHFFPKPGCLAKGIIHNGVTVWAAAEHEKCIACDFYPRRKENSLLVVIIKTDRKEYKYFELVGKVWTPITSCEFSERIRYVNRLSVNVDTLLFSVKESCSNGIPILHCMSKGEKISEFVCASETIWKGTGNDSCLNALVYFLGDEPRVVVLKVIENTREVVLYLYKNGDEWENDKAGAKAMLEQLEKTYGYTMQKPDEPLEVGEKVAVHATVTDENQRLNFSGNVDIEDVLGQEIFNCRETSNYNKSAVRARYGRINCSQQLEKLDEYSDIGRSESDALWNEIVHALNGGNVEIESPIGGKKKAEDLEQDVPYNGLDEIINWSHSEDWSMEQIYVEPRDNFTYYPSNLMIPDKGPSGKCAMKNKMITPLFFPTFNSGSIINVSKYNPTFYNLYDYYLDDVITRLIVPWSGTKMTSLSYGRDVIWNAGEGESLVYATIHLRETVPVLVYILKNSPSANKTETIMNNGFEWRPIGNYMAALKKFPRPNIAKLDFAMDLTYPDNGKVKVFDTVLDGIKTRLFVPRLGFRADLVNHGGTILWRSPEYEYARVKSRWRVVLVRAYLRGDTCFLVKMTLKERRGSFSSINYIHLNGRWIEVSQRESERAKWALRTFGDVREWPTRHF
ncbi:hypothetical protein BEWA_048400 [Theileria equi strain WA]|uniref:Signal peptide-containing protein n=1 Tax=Theileria equi strain WA TaxID=1537102 RepID=L1LB49_THEEQ|nr:hypothetical protein BEWA_048400 [Theileria equi strain WA]EKX72373.1 hypothetical protein BEWA_048400 [Theileria equi strain WA]|eukprot:XP_004831825.1 hypothetical protein BEWA_048400 [Theileria equi strain WA]